MLAEFSALPVQTPVLPPEVSTWSIYEICRGEIDWDEELADEDHDEEEFIPEQIQRESRPGRNDPCWCGSGKKYKKCHLDADEELAHKS
jgi:hypothetical protein